MKTCPYCKKKFFGKEYYNHLFKCKKRKELIGSLFNKMEDFKFQLSERIEEESRKGKNEPESGI